jgi:tetratricopeptide (TPR) repeat protein|tara:strand:+ start:24 stop:1235 length:1212 start_codon:yes stop_codon:yes gene_type:complete
MFKICLFLSLFPVLLCGQTYKVKTTYDPFSNSSSSTITKETSPYGRQSYMPEIKPFTPNYKMLNNTLNQFESKYKNSSRYYNSSSNRISSTDIHNAEVYSQRGVNKWNANLKNMSYSLNQSVLLDYNKAIQLNPYLAQAYQRRAGVFHFLKNYNEALKDINKAIEIELSGTGISSYRNYKKGEINNTFMSSMLYDRSQTKGFLKDFYGEISDLNYAIKYNNKNGNSSGKCLEARGIAKYNIEDFEGSVNDLTNAFKITYNPDRISYRKALNIRAEAYEKLGEFHRSSYDWFALKSYYKENAQKKALYLKKYADTHMKIPIERNYEKNRHTSYILKAIESYNEAIELDPCWNYHCDRAMAYENLKQYSEALADVNLAIEICNNQAVLDMLVEYRKYLFKEKSIN